MAFYGKVSNNWKKLSPFDTYKTFFLSFGDDTGDLRSANRDGTDNWLNEEHTDSIVNQDIDENFNTYTGSTDTNVKKFDSDGNLLASNSFSGKTTNSIAYSRGNVFVGTDAGSLKKLNADTLDEIWEVIPHGAVINGLGADENQNVYTASGDNRIKKFDGSESSPPSEEWSFNLGETLLDIYVGPGDLYVCDIFNTLYRVDGFGNQIWSTNSFSESIDNVTVNEDEGFVYAGDGNGTLRKFDIETGDVIYDQTVITGNGEISQLTVDKEGILYVGAVTEEVKAIEDTGNTPDPFSEKWSFTQPEGVIESIGVKVTT